MSQENVETLRQAADALARDGFDGLAEFWTKIARGREYSTREEALEAAGLRE